MAAALAVAAAGCLHDDEGNEGRAPDGLRSGFVAVAEAPARDENVAYVVGREAFGISAARSPTRLAGAVNTALFGSLAPAAVLAPRRPDVVAYASSRGRMPVVRVRDAAGKDTALAEGAVSVAWGPRGLAYVQAPAARIGAPRPFAGDVVVRSTPRARPVRWTRAPAQYVVAAWARGALLAYRLQRGWPDLLALDGPRRERRLARAAALVAVSPDGRRAFVSSYDARPAVVRVIDVARGIEQARLRLRNDDARWVIESGSWLGDRVVAPASVGLIVFRVGQQTIDVEQLLRFRSDAFPALEPRLEPDGQHVVVRVERPSRPREALGPAQLLRCDRRTLRCVVVATGSSADPPRAVYNPSRP